MDDLYVLKLGGATMSRRGDMLRLSGEIASLVRGGAKVVVVHGGGPEISAEMERRGLTPRKVDGVRVTDAESLAIAESVLARINGEMVSCLEEAGVRAVGMSACECALCARKAPVRTVEDGMEAEVDLGLVGDLESVRAEELLGPVSEGAVPVVYPIGADSRGCKLNVNADAVAAGIAAGIGCRELVAVTDVPGILMDVRDPSSKLDTVTLAQLDGLISRGVVSGGMVPKVEACRRALLAGASKVRMVDGRGPGAAVSGLLEGAGGGTVITRRL